MVKPAKSPKSKPRTLATCEAYLDRLAELVERAGAGWQVYQPLIERLEQEARLARANRNKTTHA